MRKSPHITSMTVSQYCTVLSLVHLRGAFRGFTLNKFGCGTDWSVVPPFLMFFVPKQTKPGQNTNRLLNTKIIGSL